MEVLHLELGGGVRARRGTADVLGPIELAAGRSSSSTVLGVGPLGRVEIPGSNRLVMAGWTPGWRGFFVSTLGSAGAAIRGLGIDAVTLDGRADEPSALLLPRTGPPRLLPVPLPEAWRGERPGTHAMLAWVGERSGFSAPRVFAVGPGARSTTFGAVASATFDARGSPVLETWGGRGGFGSKWFAGHGLVAIAVDAAADAGYAPRPTTDALPSAPALASSLAKYRYHPALKAGGTLGANLAGLRDRLLAFNHRSVDWPRAVREAIHERLVEGHFLRQHREDTDGGRKGRDCGETCPAQCRRVASGQKKDFQPFAALGPSIGIFDQRAAEEVYGTVEEFGIDAVDAGALAGWAMERIAEDGAAAPEGAPRFSPDRFDPESDSRANARIAVRVLREALATDGAPRHLVDITSSDPDRAVVVVNDAGGGVAPTQYWAPGVLAPTPIVGKYYTDYSLEFVPPRELGRRCGERTVAEVALDNLGLCRFQREWAEDRLEELVAASGGEGGVMPRHRTLARRLAATAPVALWRGARVRAIVSSWVREAAEDDPGNGEVREWRDRFHADPRGAARAFYRELKSGIDDVARA